MTNPSTEEAKKQAIAKLKGRAINGTATGLGIASGAAAGELLLAGMATAAETAAVAVETVAIIPTVLTIATVGAVGYGAYRLVKRFRG